jgi:hypothetical protein
MKKLREFPEWPLEQVDEVARMLYGLAPFKRELWRDDYRWKALAREACDLLDNCRAACHAVLEERKVQGETYARANARLAEAGKLPEVVPFEKAVLRITGKKWIGRALPNFEKFLDFNTRREPAPIMRTASNMEAIVSPKLPAKKKRQLDVQIKTWRENGIPRAEVMQLQSLFQREWPLIIAEQNRRKRKKRGGTPPKAERRLQPALTEVAKWGKKNAK